MKPIRILIVSLLAILVLAGCAPAGDEAGAYSGTFVLEGRHSYPDGQILPGVLVVLDGAVTLEPGARVGGPVYLLGGDLTIDGQVDGDVSAVGGRLRVGPAAQIGGDLRVGVSDFELAEQANVTGEVLTGAASGMQPQDLAPEPSFTRDLVWAVVEALLLAGLAYMGVRVAPRFFTRVMNAAVGHPVVSLAMGILAAVVGLVFLVIIAFTLILIPVTLLGVLIGFLAIGYGLIGIGLAVGRRLAAWRSWDPRSGKAAFVGTLVFMLALNLLGLIPYVGDYFTIAAAGIGLGAVTLTRFGLREFVPQSADC